MSDPKISYVVGFAFDNHGDVILIQKNRPEWQKGYFNGVGGKVEDNETPLNAMIREFEEETGLRLENWEHFVTMEFPGAVVYFYKILNLDCRITNEAKSLTDEPVHVISNIDELPVIPNLRWLIPLATYTADNYKPIYVKAETLTPGRSLDCAWLASRPVVKG